jgi:hypothetical protein
MSQSSADAQKPTGDDYETVARQRGWETKRENGSLNAGVIRYGGGRPGYQWVGDWKEACWLDGLSAKNVVRLAVQNGSSGQRSVDDA